MELLVKPFVELDSPGRYFFVTFIALFCGLHLVNDMGYLYTSYKLADPEKLFLPALFTGIVIFISRYLSQEKALPVAHPTITS